MGVALTAAAPRPQAAGGVVGGHWEIAGLPGSKGPMRHCVGDPLELAQVEHSGQRCSRNVLRANGTSTLVEYSCSAGDFGRSKLTLLTPRSVRIETQGISDRLPFNYVLQARRVGDCPARTRVAAH
jgi:hypothetical protein